MKHMGCTLGRTKHLSAGGEGRAGKNADWDSGGVPAGDAKDSDDFMYLINS